MNIKKLGHCCLVIQMDSATIVTDPGLYTTTQNDLTGIDAILITHEHSDHLHIDSVKAMLAKNPSVKIITNTAVGQQLDVAGIPYLVTEGRGTTNVKNISIEAFDCKHEEIFEELGQVQNTGYLIADKLFLPGDSFFNPGRRVDTLAVPIAGPWCRFADAMRYALAVKPAKAFPIHDSVIVKGTRDFLHRTTTSILNEHGTAFTPLDEGEDAEF